MKKGDYVIEPYRPTGGVDPKAWRIEEMSRGKALLRQVDLFSLTPLQTEKRVEVFALRDMYQLTPEARGKFRDLSRQLRQVKRELSNLIEELPADFKKDLPTIDEIFLDPRDRPPR